MTQNHAENFIRKLADNARVCGEKELADYLSKNLTAIAADYRDNPRQPRAGKDNAAQKPMR